MKGSKMNVRVLMIERATKRILFQLTELKLMVVGLTSSLAPCLCRLTMLCSTRSAFSAALGSPLFARALITFVMEDKLLDKIVVTR